MHLNVNIMDLKKTLVKCYFIYLLILGNGCLGLEINWTKTKSFLELNIISFSNLIWVESNCCFFKCPNWKTDSGLCNHSEKRLNSVKFDFDRLIIIVSSKLHVLLSQIGLVKLFSLKGLTFLLDKMILDWTWENMTV